MIKQVIVLSSCLTTYVDAETYTTEIENAMRDCRIRQGMTHSDGSPPYLKVNQLIQLQKSEDSQTINIHHSNDE